MGRPFGRPIPFANRKIDYGVVDGIVDSTAGIADMSAGGAASVVSDGGAASSGFGPQAATLKVKAAARTAARASLR
jgi:hypothetical protein